MAKPTLEEIEAMSDEKALEAEAKLIEDTDNSVRPEDGPQPPQDEAPALERGEG